jgi:hypothetical protein
VGHDEPDGAAAVLLLLQQRHHSHHLPHLAVAALPGPCQLQQQEGVSVSGSHGKVKATRLRPSGGAVLLLKTW